MIGDRQADRQTDKQTDRQADRQRDRQTDRHNPATADRKRPAAHPKPSGHGASANTHRDAHAHTHAHARKNGRFRVKAFGGDATLDAKALDTHAQRHLYVVAGNDRARQPHSQRLSEKDLAQEWRLRIAGPAVKGEEGRRYTESLASRT